MGSLALPWGPLCLAWRRLVCVPPNVPPHLRQRTSSPEPGLSRHCQSRPRPSQRAPTCPQESRCSPSLSQSRAQAGPASTAQEQAQEQRERSSGCTSSSQGHRQAGRQEAAQARFGAGHGQPHQSPQTGRRCFWPRPSWAATLAPVSTGAPGASSAQAGRRSPARRQPPCDAATAADGLAPLLPLLLQLPQSSPLL